MLSNYIKNPDINKMELVAEGIVAGGISLGLQFLGGKIAKRIELLSFE